MIDDVSNLTRDQIIHSSTRDELEKELWRRGYQWNFSAKNYIIGIGVAMAWAWLPLMFFLDHHCATSHDLICLLWR